VQWSYLILAIVENAREYSYFSLLNNLRDILMKHVKQFDTSHTHNPPQCRNTGKPVAFIAFA
jgi:hypothetical protein